MAEDQHIKWLLEGVPSWNERRERDPFTPDLSDVYLHELFPIPANATQTVEYDFLA